jgi:hypothetical protein
MVSEVDRINAVERVRRSMETHMGDSPFTFKRRRAVYRALERGVGVVHQMLDHELVYIHLMNGLCTDMYDPTTFVADRAYETMLGLSESLK